MNSARARANTLAVERRRTVSRLEFITRYLIPNRPVVITDALDGWQARTLWSPAFFKERFGHYRVSLKGTWVAEVSRASIGEFVDTLDAYERGEIPAGTDVVPYLRTTYPQRDGGDDFTGDVLAMLRDHWAPPAFMPVHLYVSPPRLWNVDPRDVRHPHFGVYISPRGAVTQLHVDGGETDAILCQLHGEKRCFLVPPRDAARLPGNDRRPARLTDVPFAPDFGSATVFETALRPGEVLFIPRSWIHEVYTTSASVSLTYNFLHLSNSLGWSGWRAGLETRVSNLRTRFRGMRDRNA